MNYRILTFEKYSLIEKEKSRHDTAYNKKRLQKIILYGENI